MGGAVKEVEKFAAPILDVAAVATGNPELLPLANAAGQTISGVSQGESIGKALGQGAIGGAEALAGQEVAGALGIGSGNSLVNNALGIDISPASTGLPDVGKFASNLFSGESNPSADLQSPSSSASDFINSGGGPSIPTGGAPVSSGGSGVTTTPSTPTVGGAGGGVSAGQALQQGEQSVETALNQGNIAGESTPSSPNLGSVTAPASGAAAQVTPQTSGGAYGPWPQAGGSSSSSTGGLSDWLPSKADVGKTALSAALPLGSLAYEAIKGPTQLPAASQALQPGGAATAPLLGIETQNAAQAQSGQLTPSQQANITQYVQTAQNQLLQQLASQGVTDPTHDSRYLQGMQQIQQQVLAMQQQYIQQAISNAVSSGGAASGNIAQVANQQIAEDTSYQDALAQAFGALGGVAGTQHKTATAA